MTVRPRGKDAGCRKLLRVEHAHTMWQLSTYFRNTGLIYIIGGQLIRNTLHLNRA